MPRADLRARLEAIAAGKKPSAKGAETLQPGFVEEHQAAFSGWERFCRIAGEPLPAPSEILAPLP